MPQPAFDIQRTAQETKLTVRGSLDINTASQLGEEIDRLLVARPSHVQVDLSGLDLAALVKLYKGVRSGGGTITIAGARDQPLAIFKLLRMDKVFNL